MNQFNQPYLSMDLGQDGQIRFNIDRTSSKVRNGENMNETPKPHSFKIV